jgi:multidrug efflux system membrane fusion protein
MKKLKRLVFFIPVLCGVLLVANMVKNKQEPTRPVVTERSRPVTVIKVEPQQVVPRLVGYGYVEPTETWEAMSEVSGKVVEVDPELKKGAFYSKGELLLRLDPESYGLAKSRGVASVMSVEAQLKELEQQRENTERLISIEQESLKLSGKELERKKVLFAKGYLSQSELDSEEKNILTQETALKNLQNSLSLIPTQKNALLAQKESDESSLSELKLDIERTVIRAPFDCRISEVNVELNELAQVGAVLLKAVAISEVEVAVQIAPSEFVTLLSPQEDVGILFNEGITMDSIRNLVGLTAEVRLPMFSREAVWEGSFRRTSESVDVETGAITVYISVEDPYKKVIPGVRPPLLPNLYCEVELKGKPREDAYLVPVRAIHAGVLHLVGKGQRLTRKEVDVEMVMGDFAIIKEGLAPGDEVILTDLVPAIEGMVVEPRVDREITERLKAFAGER